MTFVMKRVEVFLWGESGDQISKSERLVHGSPCPNWRLTGEHVLPPTVGPEVGTEIRLDSCNKVMD